MFIYNKLLPKSRYISYTAKVVQKEFNISQEKLIRNLRNYNKRFRDDIKVFFEYPYIDKQYRDSYYTYYSTKHRKVPRDSIRLSFFLDNIKVSFFRDPSKIELLEKSFLGFLTIRPTSMNLIGRNILSPTLFKDHKKIVCELTEFEPLINGNKLHINSFPHASQDGETISCAETSIINLFEYYGNKYPEYCPVLPSQIINILSNIANERQLPSSGLFHNDISYVLKRFGFSPKVYSKNVIIDEKKFKHILDIYIDSGIPILGALQNEEIGHSILIIGREYFGKNKKISFNEGISYFSEYINNYVLIDDNHSPYILIPFDNFTKYYSDDTFKNCKLTNFIVPLYSKIYVDAELAIKFTEEIVLKILKIKNTKSILRTFLASSRSFKNSVNRSSAINTILKELIISTAMPKFIWITEIIDEKTYKNDLLKGLIIIDATDINLELEDHLLFMFYNDNLYFYRKHKIDAKNINIGSFPIYKENLKGEHNSWKSY